MRERLNVRLALALLAAVVLVSGCVALVHRWQVRRNATGMLELAETAEARGRIDRTAWLLALYLEKAPNDTAARAKYGLALEKLARDAKSRAAVVDAYERVVAEAPDRADIRIRLVKLYVGSGRFPDAERHLAPLDVETSSDAEVVALLGACQEGRGNSEAAEKTFKRAVELDPHHIEWSVRRALLLRKAGATENKPDEKKAKLDAADKVIDDMVEGNPKEALAYLARAKYRMTYPLSDPSKADIAAAIAKDLAKAVELDKTNADVRLTAAATAKTPDEARGHLRAALTEHPGDERLYLALAGVESTAGHRAKAQEALREGLHHLPGSANLLFALTDVSIEAGDLPEAGRALTEIGRWKHAPERAGLLRARLHMATGDWSAARAILEKGRSDLTTAEPGLAVESDVLLGRCHEQLGEDDLAQAAYRRAAGADKDRADARAGVVRALLALDRLGEALDYYRSFAKNTVETRLVYAQLRLREYLATPVRSRNRNALDGLFDETDTEIEKLVKTKAATALLRVEADAADGDVEKAEKVLRAALVEQPKSLNIGLSLVRLLHNTGQEKKAREALKRLEDEVGPSTEVAIARTELAPAGDMAEAAARLLGICVATSWTWRDVADVAEAAARRAEAVRGIEQLERALDKPALDKTSLSPEDRVRLCAALAEACARLSDLRAAQKWCTEIAKIRPADLSVQLQLLDLAVRAQDRGRMEEAVKDIHRAEGGTGPFGQYAEAVLRIARPQDRTPTGLAEARQLLTEATRVRESWAVLFSTRAFVLELEGKPEESLTDYRRALALGDRRNSVVRKAVQLYCDRRQYTEADRLLAKYRPDGRFASKLAAEVSLFARQPDRAIELAANAVATDPKSEDHLWHAEILSATGKDAEAVEAYRAAIKAANEAAQVSRTVVRGGAWSALVRHHVRNGRKDEAEKVLVELQKAQALTGHELSQALAAGYDVLGQTERAAAEYQKISESRPADLLALRQLCDFYEREGMLAKSIPALRRALAQPTLPADAAARVRRRLAQVLAASGDPAAFQEAVRLVNQALAAAPDAPDDLLTQARVLATRLYLRRAALKVMQDVQRRQRLAPADEFFLAQLFADTGAWADGRRLLVNLLSRDGENVTYLRFFIDRILRYDRPASAEVWLNRLEQLAPNEPSTVRLRVTFLVKTNQAPEAAECIRRAVKETKGTEEPARVLAFARIADELGREGDAGDELFPVAKELYSKVADGGAAADELTLAAFLARVGKTEDAIKLALGAKDRAGALATAAALLTAAYARPTHSDAELDKLEAAIEECLGRSKSATDAATVTGLMHARRGRYAEAATALRTVVEARPQDAEAANNLAYMLVLANSRPEEVSALLEKAIARVGPTASLLDTRGMARLAAGKTGEAVTDFEQAVEQSASAAKCLHLALAYQKADRAKDAAALLARAKALRADGSLVLPAEEKLFERLTRELGANR